MKPRGIKTCGSRKRIVSRIGIAHDADSQHASPEMIPLQHRLLDPGGAEPAAKSGCLKRGREKKESVFHLESNPRRNTSQTSPELPREATARDVPDVFCSDPSTFEQNYVKFG